MLFVRTSPRRLRRAQQCPRSIQSQDIELASKAPTLCTALMHSAPHSDPPSQGSPVRSAGLSIVTRDPDQLIFQALELLSRHRYALHPIEAVVQYHRAPAEIQGDEGNGGLGFEQAEAHYRRGAQGLRLSEIPQLAEKLPELSRLVSDFAYLHPVTGILAHDLHDENVVRLPNTVGLAVIDPYISLARPGTWAALKLTEVGFALPPQR